MTADRISVVIATRNRRDAVLRTLARLAELRERPPIIVVDDASEDGTAEAVRARAPDVTVVQLRHSRGAAARNVGVDAAETDLVAFSDDDSWWAPGSLARASELFAVNPAVALVAARILVGEDERLDPTSAAMAASPLRTPPGVPGRAVLGFVACGAVVRRAAFQAVGGFARRLGTGGEEQLLALDLASRGWALVYADDIVVHHHPPGSRDGHARARALLRNRLTTAWLRRSLRSAASETALALREGPLDRTAALALAQVAANAVWIARNRTRIAPRLERQLELVDRVSRPPPLAADG